MEDSLETLSKWVNGIAKDIKSIDGKSVAVGLINGLEDPVKGIDGLYEGGKMTVGELALIHEYGDPAGNIPKRSMVELPLKSSAGQEVIEEAYKKAFDKLWNRLGVAHSGFDALVRKALDSVGRKVADFLYKNLESSNTLSGKEYEALSDDYEKRKTRKGQPEEPLITTNHQLLDAISWEVEL